jgi:hypothetical protein
MNEEVMQEVLSADQQIDTLKRILVWYEAYEGKCAGDPPIEDRKIYFVLSQVLEEHKRVKAESEKQETLIEEAAHVEKD